MRDKKEAKEEAMILPVLALGSMLAAPGSAAAIAPQQLSSTEAEKVKQDIIKDRAHSKEWLQSDPQSYLATMSRKDFGAKKTMNIGSAGDNDVRLQDSSVQAHHLRVEVMGDKFHVEAVDAAANFTLKESTTPVAEETTGPTTVGIGRFRLRLSHQGFPAIIVFDPKSPRFKEYKGIEYFPIDLSYYYIVTLIPNSKPETVTIMSTRGNHRHALRLGWFEFLVGNTPCRLEATRLIEPGVADDEISVLFRDATTGKESYPVGRYVEPKKLPDGRYVLDFNMSYNPACAFSNHYNCPLPPKGNTLPVAIRAGEMDSHYH